MSVTKGRCIAKGCGNKGKGHLYCDTCKSRHRRMVMKAIVRQEEEPVLVLRDGTRLEGDAAREELRKDPAL